MSIAIPETNAGLRADPTTSFEQFPVDASIFRVSFEIKTLADDFIRILVTSGISTAQQVAFREYHYNDTAISIEKVASFVLRGAPIGSAKSDVDGFVGTMPQQFSVQQAPTWIRGVQEPTAARRRLYKATDPDDATKRIGVLLEQDAEGRLAKLTWYKTKDTGPLFRAVPAALEFELVKDAAGNPSTDPKDIGGWVWYFAKGILT